MLEQFDRDALLREIDPDVLKAQADDGSMQLLLAQRVLPGVRFAAPPPFWTRAKEQFRLFLCTEDKRYDKIREEYRQRGREASTALVGVLAGAIAATLGISAAVLVPFVALLLYTALTIGVGAYCVAETPA